MTITHVGNTPIEDLDLVVVGGGNAGKTLAMDSGKSGPDGRDDRALQDRRTCINVACIPTKPLINSGRVLNSARRATEFGITGVENRE
jgi:pyruvate/2-oxoglutarate dehydrogenase complex dihydrolipoamide dehydrogenase (E3) component